MSRHVIVLFKEQKSRENTYLGHVCSTYSLYCVHPTVPCSYTGGIQDMKIGDYNCGWSCPTQNICLKPDEAEANIGKSSTGLDPLIGLYWDLKPPNIKCIYDLDRIDTHAQINALKRLFPAEQINHLMRSFCTQKSNGCPNNRIECSKLTSLNESGLMCREWLASLPSDDARDSVRREYCLQHNTEDCKCINRSKDQNFIDLKNGMDSRTLQSTRCWYKPCEDNTNLLLDVEQKQECVANICQSIIEAHAQGNIDISRNTSSLNCSFTKKQLSDANQERAAKIVVPENTNFLNDYKLTIITTSILFFLAIVIYRTLRLNLK